ncbi:MAG: MBL fold metallo-hydrolase [Planctomycetes bacterium]|nr:MBL fold metallo-hydrolase [Planctomycetota bacterium]
MASRLVITDVYDNIPSDARLASEPWGFAALVEGPGGVTLFDTGGSGEVLLSNMSILGLDPTKVQRVCFSHIHGDHTRGVDAFLAANPNVTVYAPASFPDEFVEKVTKAGAKYVAVSNPVDIAEGIKSTGEMGVAIKEQSLVIESAKGPVLLTGCAHPGIVEITERAGEIAGESMYLVVGGFHLEDMSRQQVETVSNSLKGLRVKRLAASHCTGEEQIPVLRELWGADWVKLGCGASITIE